MDHFVRARVCATVERTVVRSQRHVRLGVDPPVPTALEALGVHTGVIFRVIQTVKNAALTLVQENGREGNVL